MPVLEKLVRSIGHTWDPKWKKINHSEGEKVEITTTVQVTTAYFRAIAKIVFHYALYVFPDLTGHEREFEGVKNFIFNGSDLRDVDNFVVEQRNQFVANFKNMRPTQWSHFLAVERSYHGLIGFAQFFAGPNCLPFPYKVLLGRSPDRVRIQPEQKCHQFVIDEPEGEVVDMEDLNYVSPVFFN